MAASMRAPARLAILQLAHNARAGSPLLWKWALAFFAIFAVTYAGTFIDGRLLNGVSVWEKPAKFFLSLSVQMATLAWGLSLLPPSDRQTPAIRTASVAFLAAASFEMFYITLQAARGEASHFNDATSFTEIMYVLMGVGAVSLATATGFIGWWILRNAPATAAVFAMGVGLILGGALAIAFGGYMSQQEGHWVGGGQTDATGLPFLHWSTTGGDLRVAHFFGLHIMQALPLLGLLCRDLPMTLARSIVLAGAMAWVGLTTLVFVQALHGRPFIDY